MLTQGIKRWLRSLFAWWPWSHASNIEDAQIVTPLSRGTTQETILHSAGDGQLPHSHPYARPQNIITISIESAEDDEFSDWPPFENPAHASFNTESTPTPFMTTLSPFMPAPSEEEDDSIPFSELYDFQATEKLQEARPVEEAAPIELLAMFTPSTQQHLAFMRYLVERGIMSDDIV